MSISVARDVTEHVKPPRAVFVPFRMGHHFGVPFHVDLQRRIILEAVDLLTSATASGEIPKALATVGADLLAADPDIRRIDILAVK